MSRHISYSELASFRHCPHKHTLEYRERWTPAEVAPALNKGRLWHEVMEAHYRIEPPNAGVDSLRINELLYAPDGTQDEVQELVTWMYERFCEKYGQDEDWDVLEIEKKDEINLPIPGKTRRSPIKLKIKIDQLRRQRSTGLLWLWDFKTGARMPNELGLALSDQFVLYQWGYEQMGYTIEGVVFDFARTQKNKGPMALDDSFLRIPIFSTDQQLLNTAEDAWRTAKRIAALNTTYPERCTDSEMCIRKCSFTESCLAGRKGMDEVEFMQAKGYVIYDHNLAETEDGQ